MHKIGLVHGILDLEHEEAAHGIHAAQKDLDKEKRKKDNLELKKNCFSFTGTLFLCHKLPSESYYFNDYPTCSTFLNYFSTFLN